MAFSKRKKRRKNNGPLLLLRNYFLETVQRCVLVVVHELSSKQKWSNELLICGASLLQSTFEMLEHQHWHWLRTHSKTKFRTNDQWKRQMTLYPDIWTEPETSLVQAHTSNNLSFVILWNLLVILLILVKPLHFSSCTVLFFKAQA